MTSLLLSRDEGEWVPWPASCAPRWVPPASTPDREFVRAADDHSTLARQQLGPSYRSAFGMIAFVHVVHERERGHTVLEDQGIRTLATGNLVSFASGSAAGAIARSRGGRAPASRVCGRRSTSLLEQIGDALEGERDARLVPAAAPVAT